MKEIWKDIDGYEGYYQVSSKGNVRSVDRTIQSIDGIRKSMNYSFKGRVLKQGNKNNSKFPYKSVVLHKGGISKSFRVHRLVANAFIPNPDNLPEVNHKDENPSNNNVENLEWCTPKYNVNYGTATKRRADSTRNNAYNQKPVICIDTGVWYPNSYEAQRKTGIRQNSIKENCKGHYKSAGGYRWKWADE